MNDMQAVVGRNYEPERAFLSRVCSAKSLGTRPEIWAVTNECFPTCSTHFEFAKIALVW
jgi:hypothetical protein